MATPPAFSMVMPVSRPARMVARPSPKEPMVTGAFDVPASSAVSSTLPAKDAPPRTGRSSGLRAPGSRARSFARRRWWNRRSPHRRPLGRRNSLWRPARERLKTTAITSGPRGWPCPCAGVAGSQDGLEHGGYPGWLSSALGSKFEQTSERCRSEGSCLAALPPAGMLPHRRRARLRVFIASLNAEPLSWAIGSDMLALLSSREFALSSRRLPFHCFALRPGPAPSPSKPGTSFG